MAASAGSGLNVAAIGGVVQTSLMLPSPTARRASVAAPSAGPTSPPCTVISVRSSAEARMRSHISLRAPPPMASSRSMRRPPASKASSPSAIAKATPSITARARSARLVALLNPKNTPDAAASLCGVRSPER